MSKRRSSGRQKPAKKRRLPDRLVFFIDECLGGRRLAEALKACPNVDAILLQEEFERGCDDVAWIPEVAANRWVILTQDDAISRRELEIARLQEHGAMAFILTEGSLSGQQISDLFVEALPKMTRILRRYNRPIIYKVSRSGALSRLAGKKRKKTPGPMPRPKQPKRRGQK